MDHQRDPSLLAATSFIYDYDTAQSQETSFLKQPIPNGFQVSLTDLEENGVLWQAAAARSRSESIEKTSQGLSEGWFKQLARKKIATITARSATSEGAQ